jgi:CheY-like chemotaxis protein
VSSERRAEQVVELARANGHRVVVALDRTAGFALAAGFRPKGILLHGDSPRETLATLGYLKRRRETRHVPVCASAEADDQRDALRNGAAFTLSPDPDGPELEAAIERVMSLGLRTERKVLVLEDDEASRRAVSEFLGRAEDVEVVPVASTEEACEALDAHDIDLLVLDLQVGDTSSLALLEQLRDDPELSTMPVIIHTGKDLTRKEETQLQRHAQSIVVKTVGSPARLLDETLLHLHRAPTALPAEERQLLEDLYAADEALRDKRVLVVDDDDRNVYALTRALEAQGMIVDSADNGAEALERLDGQKVDYDLVLMDIMMPEMDGHEATRRIREQPEHRDLPIITLTAKAMREDRSESLAAGASDFITKPVDIDQLLSLLRVWLYR